jgi:aminobenzoyl-glutamate utilization protein A
MKKEEWALKISDWKRDFQEHPETGFLEMRTASIVSPTLEALGFDLQLGKSYV